MAKATWRGHRIYWVDAYHCGWAKIRFYDEASYFAGTGACWVRTDDIILEAE